MIDVEVRNFQSIEHATLPINGFTALVGKSNIGKSAFVRAIKYALTGATGTHFVRHGMNCARVLKEAKTCECYCSVTLRAEGFELVWEKGDKRNKYIYNGEVHEVPNRGTPDFLEKPKLPLDFGQVKIGDSWSLLQIADQFDNTFLLNQSGVTVADVISDVAHLDCINGAMRLVEKDRREAASTRKVREQDLVGVIRDLGSYEGLDADVEKVGRMEGMLTNVTDSETRLSRLSGYIEEIRGLGFRVDQLQKACGIMTPDAGPVVRSNSKLNRVSGFLASVTDRAASVRKLIGVETVPTSSADPLVDSFSRQEKLDQWVIRLRGIQKQFAHSKGVESIPDHDVRAVRASVAKYTTIQSLLERQQVLARSIQTLSSDLSSVEESEKAVLAEQTKYGRCPTCSQFISFVSHVHEKVVS